MRQKFWLVLGLLCGGCLAALPSAQPLNTQIQIAITQLTTGVIPFTNLRNVAGAYINWGATAGVNGYGLRDNAGVIEAKNSGGAWLPVPTSATLPTAAPFITRTPDSNLSNETALSSLATAILVNTTTTGVLTAYAGTTCTNQFVRALSAVGAATCEAVVITTDTTGTLTTPRGGTGLTSGTSGGIPYFAAATTISSSTVLTQNQLVAGGGAGGAPVPIGSLGTATTLLHGNAGGLPTYGAVVLTTDVSGILPTANGGTSNAFFTVSGPATLAKTFTFPNASATVLTDNTPVTEPQGGTGFSTYAVGDLLQADATNSLARLAATSTGNALISGGVGVVSSWGKIGLTTHISGTLAATNGGTGFASYTTGDLLYANSGTTLARLTAPALGQVIISQGAATAPIWSTALRVSTIALTANLTFSGATPTISAGFGTGASVTAGTAAAFRVDVGTGGTATNGTVGLPTAATGWNCDVEDLTATTANVMDARTVQLSSTTTTAVFEHQTVSTGAALAWTASDVLAISCVAF